jgi:hypothetical protein
VTVENDERAHVLSNGVVIGGRTPANRPWAEELARLMPEVSAASDGLVSRLNVNVVSHIAGNLVRPEFVGLRTGSYRRTDSLRMVQVAVADSPPEDSRPALISMLREAVAEAERWSAKKCLPFSPEPFDRIFEALAASAGRGLQAPD